MADGRSWRDDVSVIVVAAGMPVVFLSLAGFAGRYCWMLDLASHFRVQYLVILAGVAAVLLLCRAYRLAILFAAFAALNGALIAPLYATPAELSPSPARVMRAMMINVHTANANYAAMVASVAAHDPDFVLFEEVDNRWMARLSALAATYPYRIARPRGDNFGIALFSKHLFSRAEIVTYGEAGVPSVLAEFDFDGRALYLLGTHPLPPISSTYARRRDQQLAAIAEAVRRLDEPLLLLGDLNVSPWSYHFKRLLERSGLRDGALGHGFQPSWPTGAPPLLIPIDHALRSPGVRIVGRATGPDVGSDHYPVVVDFLLTGDVG